MLNDITLCQYEKKVLYLISSMYVCMVNVKLKYNFVETPHKAKQKKCCVSGNDLKNFWVGRPENNFIL